MLCPGPMTVIFRSLRVVEDRRNDARLSLVRCRDRITVSATPAGLLRWGTTDTRQGSGYDQHGVRGVGGRCACFCRAGFPREVHHQPLRYGIAQCPNSKLPPLSLSATLLCAKLSGELRCRFGPDQTSRFGPSGQPVIMVVPSDIPMDRKLVGRIGTVLRRSLP